MPPRDKRPLGGLRETSSCSRRSATSTPPRAPTAPRACTPDARPPGSPGRRKRVARLVRREDLSELKGGVGERRRSASRESPLRPTGAARVDIRPRATASGSPTSPTCAPGRAGSTWRPGSTATPGAASDGRSPTTCGRSSSSTRCRWRSLAGGPEPGLVHHSDHGSQYVSLAMGEHLREAGIETSMGSKGSALDNAIVASFFDAQARARQPLLVADQGRARVALFEWIEAFYNRSRLHTTLGNHSPRSSRDSPSPRQRKRL